jgi:hypothetical protein
VRKVFDLPLESADLVTKDDMTLAMNDNHISHDLALQDQLHWATNLAQLPRSRLRCGPWLGQAEIE